MNYPVVDFRKPGKVPDDIGRMLSDWQLRAREAVEVGLGRHIPSGIKVDITPPNTVTGSELRELVDSTVVYRVEIVEIGVPTLFMWDRRITIAILCEILGGKLEEIPEDREITEIESGCLDFLAEELQKALQKAARFSPSRKIQSMGVVDLKELHSDFPTNASNSEASFQFSLPYGEGTVRWVFPQAATLDLISASPSTSAGDGRERHCLEQSLLAATGELSVVLGDAKVSLAQLDALSVGDVIPLNQKISDPLRAQFGGQTLYMGWPGKYGKKQMFQIDEMVKPSDVDAISEPDVHVASNEPAQV